MIVVIDGYNLLKQIFPGAKGVLDAQRNQFVRQFGYYKRKKGKDIKEIIVVFDAGPFGHATREVKHGIVVIYSGQRRSADDWIIEFAERKKGEDILVVTMDRKLIAECGKYGASALNSVEFYRLMQECLFEDTVRSSGQSSSPGHAIEKYESVALEEHEELLIDRNALDLLMEQESVVVPKDVGEEKAHERRKGRGTALSKKEKKAYAKLKKLR